MKAREKSKTKTWKFNTVYVVVRCVTGRRWPMTANQVAYQQLQEARRHNVVSEGIQAQDTLSNVQRRGIQNAVDIQNANANSRKAQSSRYQGKLGAVYQLMDLAEDVEGKADKRLNYSGTQQSKNGGGTW